MFLRRIRDKPCFFKCVYTLFSDGCAQRAQVWTWVDRVLKYTCAHFAPGFPIALTECIFLCPMSPRCPYILLSSAFCSHPALHEHVFLTMKPPIPSTSISDAYISPDQTPFELSTPSSVLEQWRLLPPIPSLMTLLFISLIHDNNPGTQTKQRPYRRTNNKNYISTFNWRSPFVLRNEYMRVSDET